MNEYKPPFQATIVECNPFPVYNDLLLTCDCGHGQRGCIIGRHAENPWAYLIVCSSSSCRKTWFVCLECPRTRVKMTKPKNLTDHRRRYHPKKRKVDSCEDVMQEIQEDNFVQAECEEGFFPMNMEDENFSNNHSSLEDSEEIRSEWVRHKNMPISTNDWFSEIDSTTFLAFNEKRNQKFFFHYHERNDDQLGGLIYLCKRSIIQTDFEPAELKNINIPLSLVSQHIKSAKMAMILSRTQHDMFAEIIYGTWSLGCEDGYFTCREIINLDFNHMFAKMEIQTKHGMDLIKSRIPEQCDLNKVLSSREIPYQVPRTRNDIRRLFVEGKYSIVENLPYPPIRNHIPHHAVVSVIDCLRDFLAHCNSGSVCCFCLDGTERQQSTIVTHTSLSQRVNNIYSMLSSSRPSESSIKPIVLLCVLWSDDFEINYSQKSNRGSCWMKTMTFLANDGKQDLRHTYPLAVGHKGINHDLVNKYIEDEVQYLRNGNAGAIYDGATRKAHHFTIEIVATLGDQPERRSENGLSLGNATYHGRWRVSANTNELMTVLPCCDSCLLHLLDAKKEGNYTLPLPKCETCLQWDVLTNSPLARTIPPKHYPKMTDPCHPNYRIIIHNEQQYLKPFKIEYETLCSAIDLVHDKIINGEWTEDVAKAFLQVECINDDLQKVIIDHAINALSLKEAALSDDDKVLLETARQKDPQRYEKVKPLALWQRALQDLCNYIDVIMHLLFLGIVSYVMTTINSWLKCQGGLSSFQEKNNNNLEGFKSISLQWLNIFPYDKRGGWISENYLGFARLMPWFYQNISGDTKNNAVDDAPPVGLDVKKWNVKQLKHWLTVRFLFQKEHKLKKDLLEAVQSYMKKDPVPEPHPIPVKKMEHVQETIESLHDLLGCVMGDFVDSNVVAKTQYTTRIFLSRFHILSESVRKSNKACLNKGSKSAFVQTTNFQSLLNLPEAMELFGPLRCLWEGDLVGEGFVKVAKPNISKGMIKRWQDNLMENMYQDKSMEQVSDLLPTEGETEKSPLQKMSANYHLYKSHIEVDDILNGQAAVSLSPLSCILITDKMNNKNSGLFACVNNHSTLVEVELNVSYSPHQKFGIEYFVFQCNTHHKLQWEQVIAEMKEVLLDFAILLPMIRTSNDESQSPARFCLVSWKWKYYRSGNPLHSITQWH